MSAEHRKDIVLRDMESLSFTTEAEKDAFLYGAAMHASEQYREAAGLIRSDRYEARKAAEQHDAEREA